MTLDPNKSIRNSELFVLGSTCQGHLGPLLPIPKSDCPHIHPLTKQGYRSKQNKVKAPSPHLQDSSAMSPSAHRTEGEPLPCPRSTSTSSNSKLLLPTVPLLLRSTALPQPCNAHKSDAFTHTPSSFSSQVRYSTNPVSSAMLGIKPRALPTLDNTINSTISTAPGLLTMHYLSLHPGVPGNHKVPRYPVLLLSLVLTWHTPHWD